MLHRFRFVTAALTCVMLGHVSLGQPPREAKIRKPQMSDTIKANMYADNSFQLFINGEL